MNYPTFTDHSGNTWQVVTIHIVKSNQWQAEIECQTPGIGKTKTFFYSVHTGMISQLNPAELMCSVPDDTKTLQDALGALFSANP